jgi:hypothetical protein
MAGDYSVITTLFEWIGSLFCSNQGLIETEDLYGCQTVIWDLD